MKYHKILFLSKFLFVKMFFCSWLHRQGREGGLLPLSYFRLLIHCNYHLSKKSWPNLCRKLLHKLVQDFLNIIYGDLLNTIFLPWIRRIFSLMLKNLLSLIAYICLFLHQKMQRMKMKVFFIFTHLWTTKQKICKAKHHFDCMSKQ